MASRKIKQSRTREGGGMGKKRKEVFWGEEDYLYVPEHVVGLSHPLGRRKYLFPAAL
jgi:hypothetical protein